jgi:hypothetical protein
MIFEGVRKVDEMESRRRSGVPRAALSGLVFAVAFGCAEGDRVGPSAEAETVVPAAVAQQGIVFATAQFGVSQLNSTHTGMVFTATPSNILSTLSQVRATRGSTSWTGVTARAGSRARSRRRGR